LAANGLAAPLMSALIPGLRLRAIAEVFGSAPVNKNTNRSDRMLTSAESISGFKIRSK
jgi:hypothetical protein